MGLTIQQRQRLVGAFTANCSCDEERQTLNEALVKLSDRALLNLNAKDDDDDDDDDKTDNAGEDVHSFDNGAKPGAGATQAGGDGGTLKGGDDKEYAPTSKRLNPKLSSNRALDEARKWAKENGAPQMVGNAIEFFANWQRQKKLSLVHQMISGITDNVERNKKGNWLMTKPLGELEMLASMMTSSPTQNAEYSPELSPAAVYLGANAPSSGVENMSEEERVNDNLDIPVLNMTEVAAEQRKMERKAKAN
jgi:hypothetical protein